MTSSLIGVAGEGSFNSSTERKNRAKKLAGALWGVDENGDPDLEVVEEAMEQSHRGVDGKPADKT